MRWFEQRTESGVAVPLVLSVTVMAPKPCTSVRAPKTRHSVCWKISGMSWQRWELHRLQSESTFHVSEHSLFVLSKRALECAECGKCMITEYDLAVNACRYEVQMMCQNICAHLMGGSTCTCTCLVLCPKELFVPCQSRLEHILVETPFEMQARHIAGRLRTCVCAEHLDHALTR